MPVKDPVGYPIDQTNPMYVTDVATALSGCNHIEIASGTTDDTIISDEVACLYGCCVLEVGAGAVLLFDSTSATSGVPFTVVPSSAPLGPLPGYPAIGITLVNGLVVKGGASNPGMSIYFSNYVSTVEP